MSKLTEALTDLDFEEFLDALWDGGWYEYVFPFLLIYALVFTIMNQVEIFKDRKAVKVIIALVFGLFAIAFPITGEGDCVGCGQTLGELMMSLFPGVSAFSIGILALYIVAAMLGVDLMEVFGSKGSEQQLIRTILFIVGVLVVLYFFARGYGWDGFSGDPWEDWLLDPALFILVLFGLFFYWISKDDETPEQRAQRDEKKRQKKREALQRELGDLN